MLGLHITSNRLHNQITFFQVTTKVMHYFKISELLFQIINASYFVFPFIHWHLSCPMLREIGSEVQRHFLYAEFTLHDFSPIFHSPTGFYKSATNARDQRQIGARSREWQSRSVNYQRRDLRESPMRRRRPWNISSRYNCRPEISKMGRELQKWAEPPKWGGGSLRAKTFTIGFGFSQLLLIYISK